MRRRVLLQRAGPLVVLAILLVAIVASSSLLRLLPVELAPWPWLAYGFLLALLALVPALLSAGSPMPAALAVLVPALALGAYGQSRLDWLKTLKDFGVTDAGAPSAWRLLLGAGALLLVWGLHVADTGLRLRLRSEERGISAGQARMGQQLVLRQGSRTGRIALAYSAGVAVVVLAASAIGAAWPLERMAFVAPLLASVLLVVGALLVVGLREGSSDEAQ